MNGSIAAGQPIQLELTLDEMLLDGSEVTGGSSKQCYLPIFMNNNPASPEADSTWYVGSYLLRKYYMVFDATPPQQLSEDGETT